MKLFNHFTGIAVDTDNNSKRTQAIGFSGLDFRDEISERTGTYSQRPENSMGCGSILSEMMNYK